MEAADELSLNELSLNISGPAAKAAGVISTTTTPSGTKI
jgi:hypothetical protein